MAFALANFSPIGGQSARGKAPQLWSYKSADPPATVDGAGYFNTVSDMVEPGDIIIAIDLTTLGSSPEAVQTWGFHIVLTNASGVVDVSNVLAGTVTDSD